LFFNLKTKKPIFTDWLFALRGRKHFAVGFDLSTSPAREVFQVGGTQCLYFIRKFLARSHGVRFNFNSNFTLVKIRFGSFDNPDHLDK
jgi:hypothetical protein